MKVTIQKSILSGPLTQAAGGVSNRSTIPILQGIKFEASEKGLVLTGSDGDITIQAFIPLEKFELINFGSVVLDAGDLTKIINKLPNDRINIVVDDKMIATISAGGAEMELCGTDPEEYPAFEDKAYDEPIIMESSVFKDLVKQTHTSCATDEATPILTGILITFSEGWVELLGCDRHRMSRVKESLENGVDRHFVVSAPILSDLLKVLSDKEELSVITKTDVSNGAVDQVVFATSEMKFIARVLDGNYPDTTKLIATSFAQELTILRKTFIETLERSEITANEVVVNKKKSKQATLTITPREITVNSEKTVGKMKETHKVEANSDMELKVALNVVFLIAILKSIDSEYIKLKFNGPMVPIIVTPENDENILHLVLPYRITT